MNIPDAAAQTAIYLSIGYENAGRSIPYREPSMQDGDGGHVGAMSALVDYAVKVEEWFEAKGPGICCPGVFAYEFAEPLGEWLYDNEPTDAEFIEELDRRWKEWVGE